MAVLERALNGLVMYASGETGETEEDDFCVVDKNGNNKLHLAAGNGDVAVVSYLLDKKDCLIYGKNHIRETPLHLAASNGHLEVVLLLVEKGANCREFNSYGDLPLHEAAKNGNTKIVKFFIDWQNLNVDSRSRNGSTPLHYSALKNLQTVKFLIERKADLMVENERGETVMHFAAKGGQEEIIKFLADEKKLYVDRPFLDCDGLSPLYYSVEKRHLGAVYLFVSKKANVCAIGRDKTHLKEYLKYKMGFTKDGVESGWPVNLDGNSLIHVAVKNGDFDLIRFAVKVSKSGIINQCNKAGETPIKVAVDEGNIEAVKILVENGASLRKMYSGSSLLHTAAEMGSVAVLENLLEFMPKSTIENKNESGFSPLQLTVLKNHLGPFLVFSKKGANLNVRDRDNNSLMHLAVLNRSVDILKHLLNTKIELVNKVNRAGVTPLFLAIQMGELHAVKALIYAAADYRCSDTNHSPVHLAVSKGNVDAIKILVEKGADLNSIVDDNKSSLLHLAAETDNVAVLGYLLEVMSESTESVNDDGFSPLQLTVLKNHLRSFLVFISMGAELDVFDRDDNSPRNSLLHLAVLNRSFHILNYLLETRIDLVNKFNNARVTPLYLAIEMGDLDAIKALIYAGADYRCSDTNHSPAHLAVSKGNMDAIKILVEIGADLSCIVDDKRSSLLHSAVESGNVALLKYLLEVMSGRIESVNDDGFSPLQVAASQNRLDCFIALREKSANLEVVTAGIGDTLIHIAVRSESLEVLEYLLETNLFDINKVNTAGFSPMKLASWMGNLPAVRALDHAGADRE